MGTDLIVILILQVTKLKKVMFGNKKLIAQCIINTN